MSFLKNLAESIFFLLAIPFFNLAFNFMLKKMEIFFKEKNPDALSFFYSYEKVLRFIVKYIIPVGIIIVVISIWF